MAIKSWYDIKKKEEGTYDCPCCEKGLLEVHQKGLPYWITCPNCKGIGRCDWIRYAKPLTTVDIGNGKIRKLRVKK